MEAKENQQAKSVQKNAAAPETFTFMIAEYNALKSEMLKRTEIQHQLISIALVALGAILTVGVNNKAVSLVLLYPVLALFLATAWASNDRRVRQMGAYIKTHIETEVGEQAMGWEHFSVTTRPGHIWRLGTLNFWASRGIFIGSDLLALLAAFTLPTFSLSLSTWLLLAVDLESFSCLLSS